MFKLIESLKDVFRSERAITTDENALKDSLFAKEANLTSYDIH